MKEKLGCHAKSIHGERQSWRNSEECSFLYDCLEKIRGWPRDGSSGSRAPFPFANIGSCFEVRTLNLAELLFLLPSFPNPLIPFPHPGFWSKEKRRNPFTSPLLGKTWWWWGVSLTNRARAGGTEGKQGQAAPKLGGSGEKGSVLHHRAVKRGWWGSQKNLCGIRDPAGGQGGSGLFPSGTSSLTDCVDEEIPFSERLCQTA